jgi:glycosyltransferase involved in cell wall biosynthesis
MKITICMIIKNESNCLYNCLEKVAGKVNEIIVVDTGSTDNTKEIARIFTDKVFDFKWCNDFSKARNFAISKATNNWILVLDADEFVTEFDIENVKNLITLNEKAVGKITIISDIQDSMVIKKSKEVITRLFNKNYYHYEGIIHEQVVPKYADINYSSELVKITVDHVGYTESIIKEKDKVNRNISLLNEAIKSSPKDPYLYYQIGKSYYLAKNYDEANIYFEKALDFCFNFHSKYAEDLVETYGYALINSHRYSDALGIEQYRKYFYDCPDYDFLMGLIYMNNSEFSKAVEEFLKCLGGRPGKIEGVTSYLPSYNIGVIFECLGYIDYAIQYYKNCGQYKQAEERLIKLFNN